MPVELDVTLGANAFKAKGEFAFDEGFQGVFRSWVNAQSPEPGELEALVAKLKKQNDDLAASVTAHQPAVQDAPSS